MKLLFLIILYFGICRAQEWCIARPDLPFSNLLGAGTYDPVALSTDRTICQNECFSQGMSFSAVWRTTYCFCSLSMSASTNITFTTCGTNDGLFVMNAVSTDITVVLDMNTGLGVFSPSQSPIVLNPNLMLIYPSGSPVGYQFSYRDRDNIWEYNAITNPINRTITSPGVYEIRAQSLKPGNMNLISSVSRQFLVYETVTNLNLSCQAYGIVYMVAICQLTMNSGTRMTGTINVNGAFYENFSLTDFYYERSGPVPNFFNNNFITGYSNTGVHIIGSMFQYDGVIKYVEFYANKLATIDILLVKPNCASFYCFSGSICSTNITCSSKLTCTTPYCSITRSCSNLCNSRLLNSENQTSLPVDYAVVQVYTYVITSIGNQVVQLPSSWLVSSGYRLGYHTQTYTDVIATTAIRTGETASYFQGTNYIGLGTVYLVASTTANYVTHQLSAVSIPNRVFNLRFGFNTSGLRTIQLNLSSNGQNPVSVSSTIDIVMNINDTNITTPYNGVTNVSKSFQLLPYTGGYLQYFWIFGDGTVMNTTVGAVNYTYQTHGFYNFSINVYNALVSRNQSITVIIRDPVNIKQFNGTSCSNPNTTINFNTVVLGDGYNCTLSGDSFTNVTQSIGSLNFVGSWPIAGYYNLRLDCYSDVSKDFKLWTQIILANITGLRFVVLGGVINQTTAIQATWATGNNITFEFLFNNITTGFTKNELLLNGISDLVLVSNVSNIIGVLRATNAISEVILVANLTFNEFITGLQIIPNNIFTSVNVSVLFNVSMITGSTVYTSIDFNDGSNATFQGPYLLRWLNNYTASHAYNSTGTYTVTVTANNTANNATTNTIIYCIGLLGNYSLNGSAPFLKTGSTLQVWLTRISGNSPVMTNATVNWMDGQITTVMYTQFNESTIYTHPYTKNGIYNVTVTLTNPLSSVTVNYIVNILNPIVNFRCSNVPLNTWNGNLMTFTALIDSGDQVNIVFYPGDTGLSQTQSANVTSLNTPITFSYSYSAIGNFSANITACNLLGCSPCSFYIQIQYKVIRTDFQITSNNFVQYQIQNSTITISFTGTNFPTAMSATFNYFDGSAPMVVYLVNSYMPYTQIYNLNKTGYINATIMLSNLANNETYSILIGAFDKFQNFTMKMTWGPARIPGMGAAQTVFPLQQPIYFSPSSGKGTVDYYIFMYVPVKNLSAIFICNATIVNGEYSVTFTSAGNYNVSMIAVNPIDRAYISFVLTLGGSVKETNIIPPPYTLYPNYYGFISITWSIISSTACICVDLGNGTKLIYGATSGCTNCSSYTYTNTQPVNSQIKMTVRYPIEGDYNIFVKVYSGSDFDSTNRTIPITSVQCAIPVLSMTNTMFSSTDTPQSGMKGSQIIVNAQVIDLPCIITKNNFKAWSAVMIDPLYYRTIKTIDLSTIPTYNNTQLIIPPIFLDYGLYKLTFMVTMDKNATKYTFLNMSYIYLNVIQSPIVVALSTGGLTLIVRGTNQNICLYPMNFSKDPDISQQNFANWTWSWTCKNQNEPDNFTKTVSPKPIGFQFPATKTGCFGDGPGKVNLGSQPCFAGINMDANNSYVMSLSARSGDGRSGSAIITLQIVLGIPPNILIQCMRPLLCSVKQDGPYPMGEVAFNPSDSLLLNASCTLSDGTICNNGIWQIRVQNSTDSKFYLLTGDLSAYVTGIQSFQMLINNAFFSTYPNVPRFLACYNSLGLVANGQACIQYFINPLPTGLNCTVDKTVILQTDNVCCNCTYGPYNYRIYVNASGQLTTLGFTNNGYFCSIIPYQLINQTYLVRVTNSYGGFVDYTVAQIQVKPLDTASMSNILTQLMSGTDQTLTLINAKGDLQTMSQTYVKYISVITVSNQNMMQDLFGSATNGSKTNFGGSTYTQTNIVAGGPTIDSLSPDKKAKYEKDRDAKSGIVNLMASNLVNMVPGDIQSLNLVSSVVNAVTGSFDCLNRQAQNDVSNKLVSLALNLKNMQGTASRDDIQKVATSLLSATFQSDTASNTQITNGVKRDIQQSKDNFLDYDTNIDSSKASYMNVADPNAASNSLTLETNGDFQTSVSSKFGANSVFTINTVSKCLRDTSVVGDAPTDILTAQMQYFQQKAKITDLNGSSYNKGRSSIQLPDLCAALNSTDCSNPNNAVNLEIIATPNNVKSSSTNPNGNGLPIPTATDTVTINLFSGTNENEQSVKVNGTQQFKVILSRDPSYSPPDFALGDPNTPNPKIAAPQIIPGTGDMFSGPAYFEQKLIMHQFQLNGTDQSAHFQMQFTYQQNCTQFLVVARLLTPPSLSINPDGTSDPDNGFIFWGMIPTNTKYCYVNATDSDPDPSIFYINNTAFAAAKQNVLQTQPSYLKNLNNLYFGVRELTPKEWNLYSPTNRPPYPYPYSDQVNTTYKMRIFSSGCLTNSDGFKSGWGTAGCQVGPLTTVMRTQCICTHLTTFVSGFVVAPNSINFNYVFSNFDLSKNSTLFITEGVVYLFFILLLIWARRKDIKDLEKIGVTPLADNDSSDMYLYEILVDTSIRNGAGTKSKVYFILSGETDETEPRLISDSKRTVLQKGSVDRFLLAVPRTLGPLQYIRLWHDNSAKGPDASWFCNYFGVTDLQTKEKFHFLVNNWFAVEEDDGQVDRLIAVASSEELLLFGELFARKMKKDLTENHLWLSIMARPPESRFTRVERVACCLLLMFLTMLTTCMFYKSDGPSKVTDNALVIGPLAITPREVWIGLVSGIIGFLPLFIVMDLFRRSHLKHGHANKLREAVEEHLQITIEIGENRGVKNSHAELIKNEEVYDSRPNTPGYRAPDQVSIELSESNSKKKNQNNVPKKATGTRLLPWWVRIISWAILIVVLIVACFFTTMYGIQFGDMACKKWISSMFISFFASVLLIQPVKVVLIAVVFSLLCKNSSLMDDDFIDEEEELMNELGYRNGLLQDEEYLHEDLYTKPIKPNRKLIQPPSKDDIEKAREMRLREMRMFDIVREITFYIIFFITLLMVSYSFRDPNSFTLKTELEKVFVNSWNADWSYKSIGREDQFWNWALNVLVPGLRAPLWYNNQPQLYQRGFISDRNQRLMGYAIMRQVRVKKNSCTVYSYAKNISKTCYGSYNLFTEDTADYGSGWKITNNTVSEFSYQTASSLKGIPYIGSMNVYSGGGYAYLFRADAARLYTEVTNLMNSHWIDFHTRAIIIQFTTYNPNINLFAICTFLVELPGSGGLWPSYRIEPANLLGAYSSGVTAFEIFCQALYGLFIVLMIIKEIRNVLKQKWTYFKQFWNWVEMFIIGGSFACVGGFVLVMTGTSQLTTQFQNTGGDSYMNFQFVAFWNENLGYLTSFIVFAATIKFLKLLRFNRRIGMLAAVLNYCSKDMKQFFIIFMIMFMAFVMVFYALFMDSLDRYHTFLQSMEASMQIALGKFEFLELYQREPIFGPIVFALYVIFIIFVMLNMFIAILNEGFAVVRADIELQSNEFEIVDFIIAKFIMFTGITNTRFGHKLIKTGLTDQIYKEIDERELAAKVNSFPDKVDQLLNHITRFVSVGEKGNQQKKGFSDVIFQTPSAPPPKVSGNDNIIDESQGSRPSTATSNILRSRSLKSMPRIEK